jgi:hypothetical protein
MTKAQEIYEKVEAMIDSGVDKADAFYNGAVDETVLEDKQERIEIERREVHRWSEAAAQDAGEVTQALHEALLLLEKAQVAYRQATPTVRRLLNQALFEGLLIRDEDDLEANLTPWVSEIRHLARAAQGCQPARRNGQNGHDPLSGAVGFHKQTWCPVRDSNPPHRIKSPALYQMS